MYISDLKLLFPISLETYYQKEIDEREIFTGYNSELINETLKDNDVFTLRKLKEIPILCLKRKDY